MVIHQASVFLKKNLYRGVNAFQHAELVLWLSRGPGGGGLGMLEQRPGR